MNPDLIQAINAAITAGHPFVLYRLPGNSVSSLLIQQTKSLKLLPFDQIDQLKGFLMAQFRGRKINHLYCLRPDVVAEMAVEDQLIKTLDNLIHVAEPESAVYSMTQKEYLDRARYLIEVLKDGNLRKVVFSRTIDHPLPEGFRLGQYFHKLLEKYPKAFVYLIRLPGFGIWIGATPEILLTMEPDHAETVALAGTQPAGKVRWTEKEVKEQQIVMDYVEELLHKHGIYEFGRTGPFTEQAGNLVHLKTQYNLSLDELKGKIGDLVTDLHPTPAVCGLPRNKAYELIRKVEKHDRRFYSGFLGPWNLQGHSRLFVNLRCAKVHPDKMSLFVGGGLTSESDPRKEWEETVRKSETLLSVMEKS